MVDLTKKPFGLNDKQIQWVEDTIQSMSVKEKLGQLFVHMTNGGTDEKAIQDEIDMTKMGGIRFMPKGKEEMWEMNRLFQKNSKIPILSAVNVEAGGNGATSDGTVVGQEMKVAATGDSHYAYMLGKISGKEAAATGANWAYAPIVDLVKDWHNPGIVNRGFGEDPDMVLEFSKAYFKGLSESGVLSAMKHFPGDGSDERDPHIATSVNELSCEEWDKTYGKVYEGMIEAGVQSLMPGHIMMPAYQRHFNPGLKDKDLLPATVSKEILTDLLRGKLGFNGLVVSDASHMVGLSGRMKRSELVPQAIMAGCDMFLFFNNIEEDKKYMLDAYKDGRLTEERVHEALRRILGLKALAGLNDFDLEKDYPSKDGLSIIGCEEHQKVSEEVSEKAITLAKQVGPDIFPVTPKKYKRILLVPVGPEPSPILAMAGMAADGSKLINHLKKLLESRGFEVEIYQDPVKELMGDMEKMTPEQLAEMKNPANDKGKMNAYQNKLSIKALTENYDLALAVANVSSTMRTTQRLEWAISKGGWDNPWYVNELPVIFASFNCPFHLVDVPQVKNYINCYDAQDSTIEALVNKMTGKSTFKGVSPVDVFCGFIDTKV